MTNRGVGVTLNDYLNQLARPGTGYFANREDGDDADHRRLQQAHRRHAGPAGLRSRSRSSGSTPRLETTMSQLQSQSSALAAQIAKLNG